MFRPLALALLLVAGFRGCVVYEYEHEFWLDTDGSGTVYVTGRPELWEAFKGVEGLSSATPDEQKAMARRLFDGAGLEVNRVTLTRRGGRPYLFVSADFADVNAIDRTRAFPDLSIRQQTEGETLRLSGTWKRPASKGLGRMDAEGLMAVRFHLPSKVLEHDNASDGVERGNILSWREPLRSGLEGAPIAFGARMGRKSILLSTVGLFAGAVLGALAILAAVFFWVVRKGRRQLRTDRERADV